VKVIARERIGSYGTPADLEAELNAWLREYTNSYDGADADLKARYPLREGRAEVREVPGRPGRYTCNVYLRPQFQLDQLAGTIRLETRPFTT
jgi:predicted component of type VI protein secretion system